MKQGMVQTGCGDDRPLLVALMEKTVAEISELGAEFDNYRRKLTDLNIRYSEGRFHLAVLGQFKRGKSTLLNALAGEPILPVGVVPLTAAPTFIQYGETPKVSVKYQDGRKADEFTGASTTERSAYLARFVTEKGNPQNRVGVAEVEVFLPAPILAGGVVLIDTPGIGSTSFSRFSTRIKERLDETVSATNGAMKTAHARRQSHGENIEEEVSRMRDRISNLQGIKKDLAVILAGLTPAAEAKAPESLRSKTGP